MQTTKGRRNLTWYDVHFALALALNVTLAHAATYHSALRGAEAEDVDMDMDVQPWAEHLHLHLVGGTKRQMTHPITENTEIWDS